MIGLIVVIIYPHTNYKTFSSPKVHPTRPAPQDQNAKKIRKMYENHAISCSFRIFSVHRFWRGWSAFRGAFWGSEGFCILYGGVWPFSCPPDNPPNHQDGAELLQKPQISQNFPAHPGFSSLGSPFPAFGREVKLIC